MQPDLLVLSILLFLPIPGQCKDHRMLTLFTSPDLKCYFNIHLILMYILIHTRHYCCPIHQYSSFAFTLALFFTFPVPLRCRIISLLPKKESLILLPSVQVWWDYFFPFFVDLKKVVFRLYFWKVFCWV